MIVAGKLTVPELVQLLSVIPSAKLACVSGQMPIPTFWSAAGLQTEAGARSGPLGEMHAPCTSYLEG